MRHAVLIGIDLGKHSFHLHAQDGFGRELFRKKTARPQLIRLQGKTILDMQASSGPFWGIIKAWKNRLS